MNRDDIEFDESGYLIYDIRKYGIENLKKIVESIPIKGLTIKLWLDINATSEIIIRNNLDYLLSLRDKGIDINFFYGYQDEVYSSRITLEQVIEDENFLSAIVEEIKTKFSSNLERTIAAFDITKNLKEYKKELDGMRHETSRFLHCYLNNDYMVCAGYSNFF